MSKKKTPDPRALLAPYLTAQCTAVLDAEPVLRQAARDRHPDGPLGAVDMVDEADVVELVHETRVAVRRLRSTLRTFADAFAEPDRTVLLDEAGWYAGTLGSLRDLDVIGDRAAAGLAALPDALVVGDPRARLDADLAERRAAQQGLVAGVLDTDRYHRLRAVLLRWRDAPVWSTGSDGVKIIKRVAGADRRLGRRVTAAAAAVGADDPDAARLLHRARRAGKRHRYAVELAAPLLKGRAEEIVAARKALQDELGSLQDSVVTVGYLSDLGRRLGSRAGRNVFSFGALAAIEHRFQQDGMRLFAARHG